MSFVTALSLAGCQSGQKPSEPCKITINLQEGDPPTLNPYVGVDLRSRCLFLALYEPLMRKNEDGSLSYAAAESVDIDPSQKIYTFHLRTQRWSNGELVTSRHFADAWKYALTPGTPCIRADLFYPIQNAEQVKKGELPMDALKLFTPDDSTLVVELDYPIPYFLELTATSFFAPLYELNEKDPTCFNGPFTLSERTRDVSLTLSKNPLYWDANSVRLDQVVFTLVKDPMTAYSLFERGEIDVIGDPFSSLPIEVLPSLDASGRLRSKLISRIFYLLLNTTAPPFDNAKFRKALSFSIDRAAVTKDLFYGELATFSCIPKTLSLLEEEALKIEDPRRLLEEALLEMGLTRETLPKITLSYAELSGQKRFAEFIQQEWGEKLGIEIDVVGSQWNTHIVNLRKRNYNIGTFHFTTLYQDPMFYFEFFKDARALGNYTGWEHPEVMGLIEQSNRSIDPKERKEMMARIERKIFDEMPAIGLFTQNLQYLVQEGVNLVISDLGIYDLKKTGYR